MAATTDLGNLTMIADSFYIPKKKEGFPPAGEDAHFFSQSAQVIGVADGVGGCSKSGIDSGEYARELMKNAEHYVKDCRPADVDPKKVLGKAYSNTAAKGSSTACIISLAGNLLTAANVGDSGFMVFRGGKIFYRSPVQQYDFNWPYQLKKAAKNRGMEQAAELAVEVRSGDVVIAGTDGLFDNLFAGEIERIVMEYCLGTYGKLPLSEILAMAALGKSLDKTTVSPFELAARKARRKYSGGKYDDITVVVAYVVPADSSYDEGDDDDNFIVELLRKFFCLQT
ncbi:hypothetical protein ABFS83_10G161000 [Erythranthe nasuta]